MNAARVLPRLVVLVAMLYAAVPAVAAQDRPPAELWAEFPLEPKPAVSATQPARVTPSSSLEPPRAIEGSASWSHWWTLGMGLGLAATLAVLSPVVAGRRRAGGAAAVEPGSAPREAPRKPEPVAASAPNERPGSVELREIAWWRGEVASLFYARDARTNLPQAVSPMFEWQSFEPPDATEDAVRAHEALVDRLLDAGWNLDGVGERWFELRLRRAPSGTGRHEPQTSQSE